MDPATKTFNKSESFSTQVYEASLMWKVVRLHRAGHANAFPLL